MPFRRSRSLYDRDRSRPVTPSAEGYLGPNELRDVSRSPIVTAGDEDDDEGGVPECEQSYISDATTSKKSILKAPRAKTPQPSYSKGDSDLDNHRAEGDWFNTYGDDRSKGGPFSALTPSMWPARGIDGHGDGKHEFTEDEDEVQYDEFGFRIESDDLMPEVDRKQEPNSAKGEKSGANKLGGQPITDNPQQRLKWIAHLEFAQTDGAAKKEDSTITGSNSSDTSSDVSSTSKGKKGKGELLAWETMVEGITRTHKLRSMVREGIPHSLRPYIWMRLAGAMTKRANSEVSYRQIVRASSNDHLMTSRQIEKDLLRTLPTNVCYSNLNSTGIPRLRRILRGLAWLYPDIGYCQGMGMIVAIFLLLMEEEDAFWMMTAVIEEILPPSYYSPSLIGVQADQMVLRGLVPSCLPEVDTLLQEHDIELSLITMNWFLTLFSSVIHIRILLRLWDILLFEGSKVLFEVSIAMIYLKNKELIEADNSAQIFNILSTLPASLTDVDSLLQAMDDSATSNAITDVIIETNRRRHVSFLLSKQGSWRSQLEYGQYNRREGSKDKNDRLFKRTIKRSKSVVDLMLFGSGSKSDAESIKAKNIMQTELMIRLRDAILRVSRYFQAAEEPALPPPTISRQDSAERNALLLQADYSADSHAKDHEAYMKISRSKRKRARAVADFERKDDDELGFRKNDIITIVSQRDEHCWVGELNGLTGWFPAKLVQILDERSKRYCFAGDDSVSAAVSDIVRGCLCPAIKAIFDHGLLRKSPLLSGPVHPWVFIEEAASKEVERDFKSVYSRLVLCKTFRLNEDGKVLSPEELLYRCVEAINFTHNPVDAQMDVKLRSLICLGLNEQVLHLWLEVLASNEEIVKKYYAQDSFIGSPGWVQIKCELRLLSRFSFSLNPDWELAGLIPRKVGGEQARKNSFGHREESGFVENKELSTRSYAMSSKLNGDMKPIQEGVRDMLVKHHLFSWDL